jgi:hypothetical protein
VVGLAQSPAGLGDLLEDRFQPGAASNSAENAADRALLLAHVLEFLGEVGVVPRNAGHSISLRRLAPAVSAAWSSPRPVIPSLSWASGYHYS